MRRAQYKIAAHLVELALSGDIAHHHHHAGPAALALDKTVKPVSEDAGFAVAFDQDFRFAGHGKLAGRQHFAHAQPGSHIADILEAFAFGLARLYAKLAFGDRIDAFDPAFLGEDHQTVADA